MSWYLVGLMSWFKAQTGKCFNSKLLNLPLLLNDRAVRRQVRLVTFLTKTQVRKDETHLLALSVNPIAPVH